MRRNGYRGHALIESLHVAQKTYGYLDAATLRVVASALKLPLSKVYGVATFYHLFVLKPQGRHTCVVCMGTACYIKGAEHILQAVESSMALRPGMTNAEKTVSLLQARCFGACALAPVISVDATLSGNCDPATVVRQLQLLASDQNMPATPQLADAGTLVTTS